METKCWPIDGSGGLLVNWEGTTLIVLINPQAMIEDPDDVAIILDKRVEKDSMNNGGFVIMNPSQCLFVPFGWRALAYGVPASRPTTMEAMQVAMAKRKSKGAKTSSVKGRSFAKLMWVPCWSPTLDAQADKRLVAREWGHRAHSQKWLTEGVVKEPAWKDWLEALRAVGETVTADSTAVAEGKSLVRRASDVG